MRTYYTLKDKIVDKWNLHFAAQRVFENAGSAGIDEQSIEEFESNYKMNMREIHRQLVEDRYTPSPVLRVFIPKGDGRERPLGIPTVKDRVVQEAVRRVIEPIFEKIFCECSYGFRKGRSTIDAISRIEEHRADGYKWVVDADIKGYFDSIDQELLMDFVTERINDGWVLRILKSWLTAGVMTEEGLEETPMGTPQGGLCQALHKPPYAK